MLQTRDERSDTPCSLQQREPSPHMRSVLDMDTNASAPLARAAWLARARAVQQESRQLCAASRALLVRSQQWRQCYILIACAWCAKTIRWQLLHGPVPVPGTSHSICPPCYVTVTRELSLKGAHQGDQRRRRRLHDRSTRVRSLPRSRLSVPGASGL
jgi:hypothetical protein